MPDVFTVFLNKDDDDVTDSSLYAPINVMPVAGGGRQGMRWGFHCLCWPSGRAFDWSCSPRGGDIWIFLRQTWRYLAANSDENDWDRTYVSTSKLHACAVRAGKIWKSWRPTRTSESWVNFTVLSSNSVCFSVFLILLNLLRYCGIKVNESKEQPSRFLQVQLISVWLIRYNHCKLIKMTFFVPFTKNSVFKLTKCGLSPKAFCILRSVTRIMVITYNCSCNRNMYLWWCSNVI